MSSMKGKYPQDEYAKDLRQLQASKLAFRSVAEGIEHFKEGRHTEAFQCLNKALQIDPRNVEGLVARGALYANSGSFSKAIIDFKAALTLNVNHANAKKYLGETLLALGRNYEEDNKFEEARNAYIECLKINPHHQEALASLEYLKTKFNAKKIVEPDELELPTAFNLGGISHLKSKEDRKKAKKDKKKKGKKRQSSSSDSSSDSSDSSDSSSESTDDSSSSDSDSNSRSKKKNKKPKEKSLSPLSKRLDLSDTGYQFNHSFENTDDHEIKVRKFLEMGRDEDDYEDRVRQLMAETSKYQKSKQAEEAKASKKKKKSEKKLKKEKKKRKKDEKKKSKGNEIENLREALKMFENLPEFSKFQKIYNDKIKEEELKLKQAEEREAPEKWKMKFAKDERQIDTVKSKIPMKFGFNYESDEEDTARTFQSQPSTQSFTATSGLYDNRNKPKSPQPKPRVEVAPVPPVPLVNKGPVVLDKFGNFRLADPVQAAVVPRPLEPTSSTRRSRSRSRRRSRSRSRRSGSYRRRYSRSRSFSRSYSRSRSRSRGRRGFRNRGNFGSRARFSPVRNQRWNDSARESRDVRGRNDRVNRDRPERRYGRYGRSASRSQERSPVRRDRSPNRREGNRREGDRREGDRRENDRRDRDGDRKKDDDRKRDDNRKRDDDRKKVDDRKRDDGRWTENDSIGKPDLEEMEEMMNKTRKEKSIENNK